MKAITAEKMAKAIQAYMDKHNLTQEELAKKLGVSRSSLCRWLAQQSKVRGMTLRILKLEGII